MKCKVWLSRLVYSASARGLLLCLTVECCALARPQAILGKSLGAPTADPKVGMLPVLVKKLDGSSVAVVGESDLWTADTDAGVSYFDGNKWTPVLDRHYLGTTFFSGPHEGILISQGRDFTLVHESKRIQGQLIDEMIKNNAESFTKVFSSVSDPNLFRSNTNRFLTNPTQPSGMPGEGGWSIGVDKESHLWLTISRTLRVLNQGQWVAAEWPSDSNAPGPSLTIPVGDASSMYVWASRPQTQTRTPELSIKSYLAHFKNGKIEFSDAPSPAPGARFFTDSERKLWIIGEKNKIQRIDEKGVFDTFILERKPVLLDKSGVVWLEPQKETYDLWKEGKIVAHVKIPGAGESPQLYSDKPYSVWAWTASGLYHCIAEANTVDYRVVSSYSIDESKGNPFRIKPEGDRGISPKGFLYTVVRSTTPRQFLLYTIQLPDK